MTAKTILIVDDSSSLRMAVRISLKGAGYDVIEATDGREALAKLTGQKVHLILSDVNMPVMDGLSFVRELKKRDAYRFTPVVMLTTEVADDKKQQGREAGARAWIVKPFQPQQLLAAVAKLAP